MNISPDSHQQALNPNAVPFQVNAASFTEPKPDDAEEAKK